MGPARASRQFPMTHLGKRWIKDTVGQFLHTQTMVGIRNKKPAKHHTTHMVKVVFDGCNILWEIIISSRIPSFMCVGTSTAILAPTIFIKVAWPPRWHTRLNYGVQIVSLETEIKLKLYVSPNSQDQHRSVLQLALHTESAGVLVKWSRPLNMANFYYTNPARAATLLVALLVTMWPTRINHCFIMESWFKRCAFWNIIAHGLRGICLTPDRAL